MEALQIEIIEAIKEMTFRGMNLNQCIEQAKEVYDREIRENELRLYKKIRRNAYEKMRRNERRLLGGRNKGQVIQ